MYVHHKKCDKHIKTNCINTIADLPLNYSKGRILYICSQILKNEENYITHLNSKSHTNKLDSFNKYMEFNS